jgi:Xaa-Pro dipeptidase
MDPRDLDRLYLAHVAALDVRVSRVLAACRWDALVILSGSTVKRSQFDDQMWPLRPCPHFAYWVPLAEPGCVLVFRPGHRPTLLRPDGDGLWERAAAPETEAFAEAFDVVRIQDSAAARAHLPPGRFAVVAEDPTGAAAWGIDESALCPPTLLRALDELRATKTPYEVACVAEANRRARAGHEAVRDAFRGGDVSELKLHLLFLEATSQDDPETPYKNIVALGEHASTLHHVAYGRAAPRAAAESLLVDAGATCRGYASDVTRTWVKGQGAAASAFAQLVSGLDRAQQELCASVQVGMPYEELHDESHRRIAVILRDAGILRASTEEAVAGGLTRAFYPHGLGHSLGLQTHDVGCALRPPRADNPFLRNTSDVAVGQVFTIEPGIYFIGGLLAKLRADPRWGSAVDWKLVDALTPLGGARTEDDLVVLENGARNFTREQLPVGGGLLS